MELNGEANNFADGGVPSLGRHRLLTHHPPNNRSHASSTNLCVRYSQNWRISLFLSTRRILLATATIVVILTAE